MVRSRKSKSSKKKGIFKLLSLPTQVLKRVGFYLSSDDHFVTHHLRSELAIEKDLRALSSVNRLLFNLFRSDRYRSVILRASKKSLEFMAALLDNKEATLLIKTLDIRWSGSPPSEERDFLERHPEPFSAFVSQLHNLTGIFYCLRGPVPSFLARAFSISKLPLLSHVHLLDFGLQSVEELTKTRFARGKSSFSSLKRISIIDVPVDEEDLGENDREDKPWLSGHPRTRWPVIEHALLHNVSQFISRSAATPEDIELNFMPQFDHQLFYETSESTLDVLFSRPNGVACRNPRSSHSSHLVFPRLVQLSLPAFFVDLGSTMFRHLLRTSPNLRRLTLQHWDSGGTVVHHAAGSLSRLEALDLSAVRSKMDGRTTDPVWTILRLLLPSVLRRLHLRVQSLDARLPQFLSRFVALQGLFLHSSIWKCTWKQLKDALSPLVNLLDFSFNLTPTVVHPHSPPPNVDELLEYADDMSAHDILEIVKMYFQEDGDLPPFRNSIKSLCSSLHRLRAVRWGFDPKLSLDFKINRSAEGEILVDVELDHWRLDTRIEEEDLSGAYVHHDDGLKKQDEGTRSQDRSESNKPPPSSPPLPSPSATTKTAISLEEPPLPPPLLPSLEPTSADSSPTRTSTPKPQPSSPSDASPTPQPDSDDLPCPPRPEVFSDTSPPSSLNTPDKDGKIERRERRLLSILPLLDDDDDELEEGSSASRSGEIETTRDEVGNVDRFWENWVFLFESD